MDLGESLTAAAVRETSEEAGVKVELKGILHVDFSKDLSWRRVIFYAEPVEVVEAPAAVFGSPAGGGVSGGQITRDACGADDGASTTSPNVNLPGCSQQGHRVVGDRVKMRNGPKTLPDFESAGACWVWVDELHSLPLRYAAEPCTWFPYVAKGGRVMPLEFDQQMKELFVGFDL